MKGKITISEETVEPERRVTEVIVDSELPDVPRIVTDEEVCS